MTASPPGTAEHGGIARIIREFARLIPHNAALGLEILATDPGQATIRLPYREALADRPPSSGVPGPLHSGALTTLLDATLGLAAFMALEEPQAIATLDLRIDRLRPLSPGTDLIVHAECSHRTAQILFVRGLAYHDDPTAPVASGTATFMLVGSPASSPAEANDPTRGDEVPR